MRALSLCSLSVFLFVFAAHLSWWKTSNALNSKLSQNQETIFSGERDSQVQKLDKLSELEPTKKQAPSVKEPEGPDSSSLALDQAQLLDPELSLTSLRNLNQSEEHLLKLYSKLFSYNEEFDSETVSQIIYHKNLPERGPAALALKETLEKSQSGEDLPNENFTETFFELYETYALDPESYRDFYEMREALTRLNFRQEEIDEFQDGISQEEQPEY